MRKYFTFFLVLCLIFNGKTQIEEVRRITKTLCSPEFHGRGYVNGGDSISAKFIANEFDKLGLKKIKRKRLQSFKFSVNTFPQKMLLEIGDQSLLPGVHYLVNPSSNGTNTVLIPKSISAKTALNKELLTKEIRNIQQEISEYNALAFEFSNLSADTLKLIAGLTEQVATLIPVIEVTSSKFTWSVSDIQLQNVLIHVQDSVYQPHQNWKVQIDSRFIPQHQANNIIGYIPSKTKNAKTIVFTAHYDHLGRMGEATYFPGGNDNASGTAMLLSMANYFKVNASKCNLLFIAFAGEEIGLLGSKYFVEHPLFKLNKIDFLINLDIMGSGEEGITVVNATKFEKEFDALVKINDELALLSKIKKRGPAANSDHYWFTEKGVPSFFIYTQGPNKNYHDIFDTYENLSFIEYQDITNLLVKFVESFESSK